MHSINDSILLETFISKFPVRHHITTCLGLLMGIGARIIIQMMHACHFCQCNIQILCPKVELKCPHEAEA